MGPTRKRRRRPDVPGGVRRAAWEARFVEERRRDCPYATLPVGCGVIASVTEGAPMNVTLDRHHHQRRRFVIAHGCPRTARRRRARISTNRFSTTDAIVGATLRRVRPTLTRAYASNRTAVETRSMDCAAGCTTSCTKVHPCPHVARKDRATPPRPGGRWTRRDALCSGRPMRAHSVCHTLATP